MKAGKQILPTNCPPTVNAMKVMREWQHIHWNPNWNGGSHEFRRKIGKTRRGIRYRGAWLCVRFERRYEDDGLIWILSSDIRGTAVILAAVETMGQLFKLEDALGLKSEKRQAAALLEASVEANGR